MLVIDVQIIAAGSLAAGGVAGYLASGSVGFGVISGSCSLLYYARVYMQGYYFDTCYKGGTDLAGVDGRRRKREGKESEGETERTRKKAPASTVCIAVIRVCITCALW